MNKGKKYPECKNKKKCFALRLDGKCKILKETDFAGYDCPFYKPQEKKEEKKG